MPRILNIPTYFFQIFSFLFLGLLSYPHDFSSARDMKKYFRMPCFREALQHVPTFNHMNGSLEVLWTYMLKYLAVFGSQCCGEQSSLYSNSTL